MTKIFDDDVVVTGLGAITPLGINTEDSWNNLIDGKSGTSSFTKFPELSPKVAASITEEITGKDYEKEYPTSRKSSQVSNFMRLGLIAAQQAIEDSGIPLTDEESNEFGVIAGSGIGGIEEVEDCTIRLTSKKNRVNPFFIIRTLINSLPSIIGIENKLKGLNFSIVSACATGAHCIAEAVNVIKSGAAKRILAGGSESCLCGTTVLGFSSMRALSTKFNDTPSVASRPWDKARDGFIIGEGAGMLVLESYKSAKKRGAKIYCKISGCGMSCDAYHMSTPDSNGALRSMELALKNAAITPDKIDYINAHSTSTPVGDRIELDALHKVFGNRNKILSSTKSSTGHLLGAAGSVELIFSILAMNNNIAPTTINTKELEDHPGNPMIILGEKAQEKEIKYALSNSFGFGGTNVTIIVEKV